MITMGTEFSSPIPLRSVVDGGLDDNWDLFARRPLLHVNRLVPPGLSALASSSDLLREIKSDFIVGETSFLFKSEQSAINFLCWAT